jgi:hypothetical protein
VYPDTVLKEINKYQWENVNGEKKEEGQVLAE